MAELKKIGVLSLAKIQGIVMAVLGLVLGLFIGVISTTFGAAFGSTGFGALGFFAIIVLPLMYGIIGFISGAVFAFLYNVMAKWVGGIEFEVEK